MTKLKNALIALAAAGLVVSAPAMAQTRSAQVLPVASAPLDASASFRTSAPTSDASEVGRRISPAVIVGFIALLALLIAAAGGGGGGGPDSPG